MANTCSFVQSSVFQFYRFACVSDIAVTGSVNHAVASALAFADLCQIYIPLYPWPGQKICNMFGGGMFPRWFGPNCDKECRYSDNYIAEENKCICTSGYWGPDCDGACPGGSSNACNGHGKCSAATGQCECEPNWRGDAGCTTCTAGWYGLDCSLSVTNYTSATRICMINSGGLVTGFDGSAITYREYGIHRIYSEAFTSISVQARLIKCGGHDPCIGAIAAELPGANLIMDSSKGGKLFVLFRNRRVAIAKKLQLSSSYALYRVSKSEYEINGTNSFRLKMTVRGVHMSVEINQVTENSLYTKGLCVPIVSRTPILSCSSPSCIISTAGFARLSLYTDITYKILTAYCAEQKIDFFRSGFNKRLYRSYTSIVDTVGGFALDYNNTGIATTPFPSALVDTDHISIEMFCLVETTTGGTVVSFTLEKTFAVTIEHGHFYIRFGSLAVSTNIPISPHVWIKISVVYYQQTGRIDFYYYDVHGQIMMRVLHIAVGCFPAGGTLAIGQWQTSTTSEGQPPANGFVGAIDHVYMWNDKFTPSEMYHRFNAQVIRHDTRIIVGWDFNAGFGFYLKNDGSVNVNLTLPLPAFSPPTWTISTVPLNTPTLPTAYRLYIGIAVSIDIDINIVIATCESIFLSGAVSNACSALGGQFPFIDQCIRDIVGSGQLGNSMDSVLAYGKFCYLAQDLNETLDRVLCNAFEKHVPVWYGEHCTKKCYYGAPNALQDSCICEEGYWGAQCDQLCPMHKDKTCSGHGKCNAQTGKCECESNFAGDDVCSKCTNGWRGRDCSILIDPVRPPSSDLVMCVSDRNQIIRGFSTAYPIGEPGDYYLMQVGGLEIKVMYTVHNGQVYPQEVAAIFHDRQVKIQGRYYTGKVFVDGVETDTFRSIKLDTTASSCQMKVKRKTFNVFTIKIKELGFTLQASVGVYGIDVIFFVSNSVCCDANLAGLCGTCECGPSSPQMQCGLHSIETVNGTGVIVDDNNVTRDDINSMVDSTRDYGDFQPTGAGYCLLFDGASATVYNLTQFGQRYTTIEFLIKTCPSGGCMGTVFSYSATKTFYLQIEGQYLVVYYGDEVVNTGLLMRAKVWNMISMVWDRSVREMNLYRFKDGDNIGRARFNLLSDPFVQGGSLALGRWQPAADGTGSQSTSQFTGYIDDFRIWNRYFTNLEIVHNWNVNFHEESFGLAAMWKFDEGSELFAYDSISNIRMMLPTPPFTAPQWQLSNAPIPHYSGRQLLLANGLVSRRRKRSVVTMDSAQQFCTELLYSGELNSTCAIGQQVKQLYHDQCVLDIINQNNLNGALTSVISFADYCEMVLSLAEWPARSLCNRFTSSFFPYWIGDRCNIPCYFGVRDSNDANICTCLPGFWNTTCALECPGGSLNPCSGFGTCDVDSGLCRCPLNRMGADSCGTCSDGWYGKDCTLVVGGGSGASALERMALVERLGHVVNFDGVHFIHQGTGEYYMVRLQSDEFVIQGKFIRCYFTSTCMNFVALRTGSDEVGYSTVTWIASDGDNIRMLGTNSEPSADGKVDIPGCSVQQLSVTEFGVSCVNNITLVIRGGEPYISLEMTTADSNFRSACVGLLCGQETSAVSKMLSQFYLTNTTIQPMNLCGRNSIKYDPASKSFSRQFNTSVLVSDQTGSPSRPSQVDIREYSGHWRVPECDSFIGYPTSEFKYQLSGGYTLVFNGSSVNSLFSSGDVFSSSDVTIEFLAKCQDPEYNGGVMVSFASNNFFGLSSDKAIHVIAEGNIFNTTLTLDNNKWNQVVFVYEGKTGQTNIYVIDHLGLIQRRQLILPAGVFDEPGSLSLGEWQPAYNTANQTSLKFFSGKIDQFRIWGEIISPATVLEMWSRDIPVNSDNLKAMWTFDEGQGLHSKDMVSKVTLALPHKPWAHPIWEPSDSPDLQNALYNDQPLTAEFHGSKELERSAISNCTFLLNQLSASCSHVSKAVNQMYYMLCLQAVAVTESYTTAFNVFYTYADECSLTSTSKTWPAYQHCINQIRRGTSCKTQCIFGNLEDGKCRCTNGYHGVQCSEVCPGGSVTPCSDHGVCTSAGQCDCDPNWAGSNTCARCGTHWMGKECSVLLLDGFPTANQLVASLSPSGTCTQFSGTTFMFSAVGEFVMFQLDDGATSVQAKLIQCELETCVAALGVRHENNTLIIQAPTESDGWPSFTVNGSPIKIDDLQFDISNSILIKMTSKFRFEIGLQNSGFNIIIQTMPFLFIEAKASFSTCSLGTGLFGNCSRSFHVGTLNLTETTTHRDIINALTAEYAVAPENSLFGNVVPLTKAKYALSFNNTGALTKPLVHIFDSSIEQQYIVISFLVRPETDQGVIMAYSGDSAFAVELKGTVHLTYGTKDVDTSLNLNMHEWNQLVIILEQDSDEIDVYHFDNDKRISRQKLTFPTSGLFRSGGYLSLGQWQPSSNSTRNVSSHFIGAIEEFTIWKNNIPPSTIHQLYHLDTLPNLLRSDLTHLYKFNLGEGRVAHELMHDADFYLPQNPWTAPEWTHSDVTLFDLNSKNIEFILNVKFTDVATLQNATETCSEFFTSDPVTTHCGGTERFIMQYYHLICLKHMYLTRNVEDAIQAMASFAEICAAINSMEVKTLLCGNIPFTPQWLQPLCIECKFGVMAPDKTTCDCFHGYWNIDCSATCPGGAANPCSGHGVCSKDGSCRCELNWNGSADCSQCTAGWVGPECVLYTSDAAVSTDVVVAQVSSFGRITTFDGAVFYMTQGNVYRLLAYDQVIIDSRQGMCRHGHAMIPCFSSLAITIQKTVVVFNITSLMANEPYLVVNGATLVISQNSVLTYGATITQEGKTSFTVSLIQGHFTAKITVSLSGLTITMKCLRTGVATSSGLLSACRTTNSIAYSSCPIEQSQVCNATATNYLAYCKQDITRVSIEVFVLSYVVIDSQLTISSSQALGNGGLCLYFEDNGITTDPLNVLPQDTFTLEFYVKLTLHGGVIVSYSHTTIFALLDTSNGITVYYNGISYKTDIILKIAIWTKVTVVWKSDANLLELYVISSVDFYQVYAIYLDHQAFVNGGVLSFGQASTSVSITTSVFIGAIDEIRIWRRTSNPSVATSAWMAQYSVHADSLVALWQLNEGTEITMVDAVNRVSLTAMSPWNPPVWTVSDLHLDASASVAITNPWSIQDEMLDKGLFDNCTKLFTDGPLAKECEPLGPNTLLSHVQQCMLAVSQNGDMSQALEAVKELSDLCQTTLDLPHAPARLVCQQFGSSSPANWKGDSCEVYCVFGDVPSGSSVCMCEKSYWGPACDQLCPGGVTDTCNSQGNCDSVSGKCLCSAHFRGNDLCSTCTASWKGFDCSVAVSSTTVDIKKNGYAIILGNHITTVDGASIYMWMPGAYVFLSTTTISIKGLFVPCRNKPDCRNLVEVSVVELNVVLSITIVQYQLKLTKSLTNGKWVDVESMTSFSETVGDESISITWRLEHVIRIVTSDGTTVVIALYDGSLLCAFKLPPSMSDKPIGMVGNFDNNWIDELRPGDLSSDVSDDKFVSDVLTKDILNTDYGSTFVVADGDVHMQTTNTAKYHTMTGYMLRFHNNLVEIVLRETVVFIEFTTSVWIRIHMVPSSTIHLTLLTVNRQTITIVCLRGGVVGVSIQGTILQTDIIVNEMKWFQVFLTWRSSDGKLVVYVHQDSTLVSFTFFGILIRQQLTVTSLVMGRETTLDVDVSMDDCKVWHYAKTSDQIKASLMAYSMDYETGLRLHLPLDDGEGVTTQVYYYDEDGQQQKLDGLLQGTVKPIWEPSDIPASKFLPSTLLPDTSSATDFCQKTFNESALETYCAQMQPARLFFEEACVRDVLLNGTAHANLSINMFAFYCQGLNTIEECKFKGYLDFCLSIWTVTNIIILVVCLILLLLIIIITVTVIYNCKDKKFRCMSKKSDPQITNFSFTQPYYAGRFEPCSEEDVAETTFIGASNVSLQPAVKFQQLPDRPVTPLDLGRQPVDSPIIKRVRKHQPDVFPMDTLPPTTLPPLHDTGTTFTVGHPSAKLPPIINRDVLGRDPELPDHNLSDSDPDEDTPSRPRQPLPPIMALVSVSSYEDGVVQSVPPDDYAFTERDSESEMTAVGAILPHDDRPRTTERETNESRSDGLHTSEHGAVFTHESEAGALLLHDNNT